MDTKTLIDQLAKEAAPVRPLSPAWGRTLVWLAICAPYLALVIFAMSPRSDLIARLSEWRFVVELSAPLLTGIAAATAAFLSVIPGTDRRILLLPLLPLAVWLAGIGHGCIGDWIRLGSEGLAVRQSWSCVRGMTIISALPAVVMVAMLQRGAPLMPVTTAALGGLGAAGLGNFGMQFFHPHDTSIMILVWQIGSVSLLTAVAAMSGRYVLTWQSLIANSRRPIAG